MQNLNHSLKAHTHSYYDPLRPTVAPNCIQVTPLKELPETHLRNPLKLCRPQKWRHKPTCVKSRPPPLTPPPPSTHKPPSEPPLSHAKNYLRNTWRARHTHATLSEDDIQEFTLPADGYHDPRSDTHLQNKKKNEIFNSRGTLLYVGMNNITRNMTEHKAW